MVHLQFDQPKTGITGSLKIDIYNRSTLIRATNLLFRNFKRVSIKMPIACVSTVVHVTEKEC